MTLDEIVTLARDVVRECEFDADVVGVTRSEGDPAYVEVLVDLRRGGGRVAVGLDGDQDVDDLRANIAGRLDAVMRGENAPE